MTAVDILLVSGPCGPHPGGDLTRCVEALLPALRSGSRPVSLNLLIQGAEPLPALLAELSGQGGGASGVPLFRVTRTPTPIGHPAAFNWLLSQTDAPLVALLTDDVLVPPRWLPELIAAIGEDPGVLAVGTPMTPIGSGRHRVIHPGDGVVLYDRRAFSLAGPFDIRYTPGSLERLDHAVALIEAGHRVALEGGIPCRSVGRPPLSPARLEAEARSGRTKFFGKWGDDILVRLEARLNSEGGARVAA